MKLFTSQCLFTLLLVAAMSIQAQTYNLNNRESTLFIEGTSNIHDWKINAENMSGTLNLEFDDGVLESINQLEINIATESLKSGKSGMDKNTYKALKSNRFRNINYSHKKVNDVKKISDKKYELSTTGNLEIAGVSRTIDLNFLLDLTGKTLFINGEHLLDMSDYEVEPPTAMFGTIKTGEEIVIKFDAHFTQ